MNSKHAQASRRVQRVSRSFVCLRGDFGRRRKTMFGFHKSKIYRSLEGCCICKTKSSSSRFTDSRRYEESFRLCFGLIEARAGDICNACVLLVKRWKKLPAGSKKNWSHVVDARAGPGLKTLVKPKKIKSGCDGKKKNKLQRLQQKLKRQNSDARSTTSSISPSQSPSHSNQSDECSDTETQKSLSLQPVFSFLDLTYWKRQKICCGIIYKGRFGEVLIDPRLFKPCCSTKKDNESTTQAETPLQGIKGDW
ncbi:SIN3-HDAC complex associated factor, like isoform X2 [Stegostoma tigrinum]|uniref:SIN3-HDAC complex associated factor, like isoform X2 n=1 Tax=Stegostoma tigrinum TaxID=3053191 RepID=UPI00202B3448|nr:SIN3-HDAC complex associated factor, like isoform X2 [Stegostoma tigrinum]